MPAKIKLSLEASESADLNFNALPAFCSIPMAFAESKIFKSTEAELLQQAYSNNLGRLYIHEFSILKDTTIEAEFDKAAICLSVILEGDMIIKDSHHKTINDSISSYCRMSFIAPGPTTLNLTKGAHRMIIMILRPDQWLSPDSDIYTEFKSILQHYKKRDVNFCSLTKCPPNGISKALKGIEIANLKTKKEFDLDIAAFQLQQINDYHNLLVEKHFTSLAYREEQARQLYRLVIKQYSDLALNDRQYFLEKLRVSERTLQRIALVAFKIPLNEFLISYRLRKAKEILRTTNSTVDQTAHAVGYDNTKHFSRSYKKKFGISPSKTPKKKPKR